MKPTARNRIVIWCAALAVFAVAGTATAIATFNLTNRSIVVLAQGANRTVNVEPFALPDATWTVARDQKSDLQRRTVAPQVVYKSPRADNSAQPAATASKSDRAPVPVNDTSATVVSDVPPAVTVEETTPLPGNDDASVTVEPASGTRETSTNFTAEPDASNPATRSAWNYSKQSMARAQRRARYLWDTLIDRE